MTAIHKSGARQRREDLGLSREKLAREANVSSSLINQLERGYRPGQAVAQRIADALGCTTADLYTTEGR